MLESYKPYSICYRLHGHAEVNEDFETERDMENHCIIWLDYPDIDYVYYYYYDREYIPSWVDE